MKFDFIFLNEDKVQIQINFKQIKIFPDSIGNQLLENGEYYLQSNVPKVIFEQFINHFLGNSEAPTINENNIFFFHILNIEFEIPSELPSSPEFKRAIDISNISYVASKENQSKANYEKNISSKLDYFLENYTEQMYSIPITSLYNIFNHVDRKLEKQDIAYKFITNTLIPERDSEQNINLFVLLPNDHLSFIPKNCSSSPFSIPNSPNQISKIQTAIKELDEIKEKVKTGQTATTLPLNLIHIPCNLFASSKKLREVNIPPSVISIGTNAFSNCKSLEKVVIPPTVIHIESDAFSSCRSLIEIEIPSSVNYIGKGAFNGCSSLKRISIPSSVISIEAYTFSKCTSLVNVVIPSSVLWIGIGAFDSCKSLTQIEIPSSVVYIGGNAFNNCFSLTQIELAQITQVHEYTFNDCKKLEHVKIPSSVTLIGSKAFCGCLSLIDLEIPSSTVCINDHAFFNCKSLSRVKIHESMEKIGERAFYDCIYLSEVEILSPIVSIEYNAFYNCASLSQLKVPSIAKIHPRAFSQKVKITNT